MLGATNPLTSRRSRNGEVTMRRSLLLVLVGAFALLMFGVSAGYAGRTNELTRERNELSSEAAEQSQRLDNYFERARSIILLTAHNPAFAQLYATPGTAK